MYRIARKLHLWVGLILAIILLIEAITGLILAEPWIVGQGQRQMNPARQSANTEQINSQHTGRPAQGEKRTPEGTKPAASSAFGIAKGLHQGKIGNINAKWLVDLAAIGLIILTLTGVYIAIPILRAQQKR